MLIESTSNLSLVLLMLTMDLLFFSPLLADSLREGAYAYSSGFVWVILRKLSSWLGWLSMLWSFIYTIRIFLMSSIYNSLIFYLSYCTQANYSLRFSCHSRQPVWYYYCIRYRLTLSSQHSFLVIYRAYFCLFKSISILASYLLRASLQKLRCCLDSSWFFLSWDYSSMSLLLSILRSSSYLLFLRQNSSSWYKRLVYR